jgi:iron complex transport system substrate-binding protein
MKRMLAIACGLLAMAGVALTAGAHGEAEGQKPSPLTDDAGRVVSISKPFSRIISLYGAHTENLFALGAGGALVGVTRHDTYPPAVQGKPVFSYHDGLERFLAADPDLVLIRPMIDRGYAPLVEGLEKHGITVLSLQPGTVEEMMDYWRILGVLSGRQTQAARMIAAFQQAVADFRARAPPLRHRKRVYFEAIHDRMKTFTPGSMPIFALETAGGINIAADADQVRSTNIAFYGKERLLSHAADIDVYLAQRGPMNQPTTALILGEPGFEIIVARPTWRLLCGINEIGTLLYPERFGPSGARILRAAEGLRDAAGADPLPNSSKAKVPHE